MKKYPYALGTDGSNDNGLEKINPLTVRIFDVNTGKVKTSLLDMCMTPSGTALDIFNAIDRCMTLFDVPWSNCVAVGVENTNVNMGNQHSIKTNQSINQSMPRSSHHICCCRICLHRSYRIWCIRCPCWPVLLVRSLKQKEESTCRILGILRPRVPPSY